MSRVSLKKIFFLKESVRKIFQVTHHQGGGGLYIILLCWSWWYDFCCVLAGSLLTVRHGSEPALNILDGDKPYKKDIKAVSHCEKWEESEDEVKLKVKVR